MFHFNRSLEGDFGTNDMRRCDLSSEAHDRTPCEKTRERGGGQGEVVGENAG